MGRCSTIMISPFCSITAREMQPEEWQQLQAEGFQIEPLARISGAEEFSDV